MPSEVLAPIVRRKDRHAIDLFPHIDITTRRVTRAPGFPTRNVDHPPTPEPPMVDVLDWRPVEPLLASLEGHLGGDAREVLILGVEGIPRQDVPEDLVCTGPSHAQMSEPTRSSRSVICDRARRPGRWSARLREPLRLCLSG